MTILLAIVGAVVGKGIISTSSFAVREKKGSWNRILLRECRLICRISFPGGLHSWDQPTSD
jgi:hypothetical protein